MRADLRQVCALLKSFRDVCQAPVEGSNLQEFVDSLDELETVASELNGPVKSQVPTASADVKSIAA